MATEKKPEVISATFSLITQNDYKFYSLTLPSDVIGDTCFVTTRYEDPDEGFQRRLDEKKAKEIAEYIDQGFGTIPNAIVISAQAAAELIVKPGGRALQFNRHPKAFLVIDGQHRAWGYKMAKSHLRVPVIIYQGLSRKEETRLFIDINTKQRPVPNELLLDIKHLADLEKGPESLLRELFDAFNKNPDSVLMGMLSPHEKTKGKISRTTFNAAYGAIEDILMTKDSQDLFYVFNAYLGAFLGEMKKSKTAEYFISPNVFKAIVAFFPDVASKVKDRFDGAYSVDNFKVVMSPVFDKVSKASISQTGRSYKGLYEKFQNALNKSFSL